MMRRTLVSGGFAGLLLFLSAGARAQVPGETQGRLPELGRSVAGAEDSSALLINPANLAFLPNGELRYTGTYLRSSATSQTSGHAFSLAVPLGSSVATGLRLDFVEPPSGSVPRAGLSDPSYRWWTWGAAARLSDTISLGGSIQGSTGEEAYGNGLLSYTLASTLRPWDFLGLSVVAQDLGETSNRYGSRDSSLTLAFAVRPNGSRAMEFGLESKSFSSSNDWIPRATLGVDVPHVGRVRGEFQIAQPFDEERVWSASLGLAFKLNTTKTSAEVYSAGLTGTAHNSEVGADWQLSAAVRGFSDGAGLKVGHYAVKMRLEKTPSPRGHVAWLRSLWALAEKEEVDALLLELRSSPGATFAHVQELRDAVSLIRERGKRVLCHLHSGDLASLYLCAAGDEIALHPAASIEFAGLSNQYVYFGRLLEKLGIRAEVVSVGEHKSAPEGYTRAGPSEVAHDDKLDMLQQQNQRVMADLGRGLGWSTSSTQKVLESGPYIASEAKSVGLVGHVLFDDEMPKVVSESVGSEVSLRDPNLRKKAADHFGPYPSLALIYVDGEMISGRSKTTPLTGAHSVGSHTIAKALRSARLDSTVRAVVLRVETPGGSATAADVIWREVQLTAKVKPVVVSMGGYAASGGYYIAAAANSVFANPLTVTGSIGVFMIKPDVSALLGKLGVDIAVYQFNESADVFAPYRGFSNGERASMQTHLQKIYDRFVERVARGRKMETGEVDAVARGRVWTGEQAKDKGLVDEIGGLRQALAQARKLAGLSERAKIIELPVVSESLVSRALGIPGLSALIDANTLGNREPPLAAALSSLPALKNWVRSVEPMLIHREKTPMLRLPYSEVRR